MRHALLGDYTPYNKGGREEKKDQHKNFVTTDIHEMLTLGFDKFEGRKSY